MVSTWVAVTTISCLVSSLILFPFSVRSSRFHLRCKVFFAWIDDVMDVKFEALGLVVVLQCEEQKLLGYEFCELWMKICVEIDIYLYCEKLD